MRNLGLIAIALCSCVDEPELDEGVDEAEATTQIAPIADAYVRSGSYSSTNFGGDPALAMKLSSSPTDSFHRWVYLKFELGAVGPLVGAKLRLFGSAGGAPEAIASELRTSSDLAWGERTITWANRPAVSAVALGSVALKASPGWHEWDVTSLIQAEKAAGHTAVTFVVRSTVASTTGAPGFRAREDASHRPALAISTAGAQIPWRTYEAEAGARHPGATIDTGASWGQVAFEASGKQAVVLDAAGEWVQWTSAGAATHATVRYSLPDGASGTLAVYVNDAPAGTLALSSERMRESKPGSLPGDTVRFFDDVALAVPGGIAAGATVRVQKTAADAVPYAIDLLELEAAPPPRTRPDATWVEVTGRDGAAIRAAIATATDGKVWLPAGDYTVTDTIRLPAGVQLRGAGMWHTIIHRNNTVVNARLFELAGANTIRDLKVISNLTTLIGQNVAIRGDDQSGSTVENVWTEYIPLFLGFNARNTTVRGNRVRNSYKDSVHFARASVGNLAENNTFRNSGDDSIALVTYDTAGMMNNTIRFNTVEAGYWGRGLTNLGGDGNRIENNLVVDQTSAGILVGVEEYAAKITPYATGWVIRGNTIVRCGNQVNRQLGGAISIRASVDRPVSGSFEHNRIVSPPFDGAMLMGHVGDAGTATTVFFRYNAIGAPATPGYVRKRSVLAPGTSCVDAPNSDL